MSVLWKNTKKHLSNSANWMFILSFLYTLVLVTMFVVHFFTKGEYSFDSSFLSFYLPLLAFYTGNKEINRWVGKEFVVERPGELMVYLLWLVPLSLYAINYFSEHSYKIPESLSFACQMVIAIFVTTNISKNVYKVRKENKEEETEQESQKTKNP